MKKAQKKVNVKEMMGKVVALSLSRPKLGIYRKVSSDSVKVDADKRWVGVRKRLLNSDTYREIDRVRTEARVFVSSNSLPSYFKRGIYLVPKPNVEKVEKKLTELHAEMQELVKKFGVEWDDLVKGAKKPLGSLYNEADYPSSKEVMGRFGIFWRFVGIEVPVDLEDVNAKIYQREQEKAEKAWADAREGWQSLLRENMAEVVSHLVERLTPSKDGKKKVFRDSALEHVQEFIDAFKPRNIANDAQMQELVEKVRGLVKGVDGDALRDDEKLREKVRSNFTTIKRTLEGMVQTKPSRAVSFDEEDI